MSENSGEWGTSFAEQLGRSMKYTGKALIELLDSAEMRTHVLNISNLIPADAEVRVEFKDE